MSTTSTVTVHTKDQLVWALAHANEIVVEGDDELRRYVEQALESESSLFQAENQRTETKTGRVIGPVRTVDSPFESRAISRKLSVLARDATQEGSINTEHVREQVACQDTEVTARQKEDDPAFVLANRRSSVSSLVAWAAIVTVAVLSVSYIAFRPQSGFMPILRSPKITVPETTVQDWYFVVQLAWAGVALLALILLYRLLSKAIDGGQDVNLVWQVTKMVSGKLVISKTVEPKRAARRTRTKPP